MKQAEEDEYREFVVARLDRWRRTVYRLCRDWHTADDLVSITLARLYRTWPRVRKTENLDAYVRRCSPTPSSTRATEIHQVGPQDRMHLRTRTQYIQILSQSLASHGVVRPRHHVLTPITPLRRQRSSPAAP